MTFTDADLQATHKFLQSPVTAEILARLRFRYITGFRNATDMQERVDLAARLDATEDLVQALEGVIEDLLIERETSE